MENGWQNEEYIWDYKRHIGPLCSPLLVTPLVSGPTPHKTQVSELNSDIMGEYQRTLWPLSSPHTTSTSLLSLCYKSTANLLQMKARIAVIVVFLSRRSMQWYSSGLWLAIFFLSFSFLMLNFLKCKYRVADAPHEVLDIT